MRTGMTVLAAVLGAFLVGCSCGGESGAKLFQLHCSSCHPNGGNTIHPSKTLHPDDLNANDIRTPGDIVQKLRNPGPGMPRFSPAVIPDHDARRIAEYILSGFR